jgi:hypothetical protein
MTLYISRAQQLSAALLETRWLRHITRVVKNRNTCKILVRNPEEKGLFGRRRLICMYVKLTVKLIVKNIGLRRGTSVELL